MRAPLATRSNTEGGGSSVSKDLLAKVKTRRWLSRRVGDARGR